MPKEQPKKQAAEKSKGAELPERLTETPSMKYTLEACPSAGGIEQQIEMSVEHYELLKRELARLQGYAVPETADA